MKCYALGLLKNLSLEIDWWICEKISYGFFGVDLSKIILSSKEELTKLCTAIKPGHCQFGDTMGYYCAAIRQAEGCCLVSYDQKLKKSQLYILSLHVLYSPMTLEEVAINIETCVSKIPPNTSDEHMKQIERLRKLEAIEEELEITKQNVSQAVETIIERGERIEELVKKSEQLTETSFKFKDRSKEMNSCWGKCNIF